MSDEYSIYLTTAFFFPLLFLCLVLTVSQNASALLMFLRIAG